MRTFLALGARGAFHLPGPLLGGLDVVPEVKDKRFSVALVEQIPRLLCCVGYPVPVLPVSDGDTPALPMSPSHFSLRTIMAVQFRLPFDSGNDTTRTVSGW